ncbi:MAG: hypothetical protein OXN96_19880 [Bryobacterales bacterium]|nr:hypothetical protein [Bryobacterales bacterium]
MQLSDGSGLRAKPLPTTGFASGAIRAHGRSRQLFGEGESEVIGALLWLNGSLQVLGGLADTVKFSSAQREAEGRARPL